MSDAPAESAPEAPVSEPQTETTSLPEPENAEPPAPEAEPEAPFEPKVGDLVEAKWKGGKEWFPAKITAWYPPKTKARCCCFREIPGPCRGEATLCLVERRRHLLHAQAEGSGRHRRDPRES